MPCVCVRMCVSVCVCVERERDDAICTILRNFNFLTSVSWDLHPEDFSSYANV